MCQLERVNGNKKYDASPMSGVEEPTIAASQAVELKVDASGQNSFPCKAIATEATRKEAHLVQLG